jgi:glucan endo-1,3-alpha-glucosidase
VTPGSGHAEADIDDAQAMGFTAFALDLLQPAESFTTSTVDQLFTYAATTGFKLFFSIDASSDSNLDDYIPLLTDYLGAEAYYNDTPNSFPFLSTFDAGAAAGNTVSTWTAFLDYFVNQLYFVPDFDDTADYYTDIDSWFMTWGGIVDGLFSWETAWPEQQNTPTNESISSDLTVMAAATANGKAYMMPLSTLQFKHIDSSQNWYRVGEVNLPERMTDILALGDSSPDYVEVITWVSTMSVL